MMCVPMRRSNATTLQDVAREAGVAAMTVSVVLNGAKSGTRVSDATRSRILEVATRLRYRPNAVARGLSRLKMDTIGVVSIIQGDEVNLYFLEVLNGILSASARLGQNTTVFSISDWDEDEQKILQFCDGRVDGFIFVGPLFSAAFAETILDYAPMVTLHSSGVMSNTYDLNVDDELGAYNAVRHLTLLGHTRIAHFSGGDRLGARRRAAGYRRALEEAGIGFDPSLVISGMYNSASGRHNITAILDDKIIDPLPTAVFCANDAIAYGAMEELSRRGIAVPDDISVVGYDDMMTARMTNPPLTTVRQPFHQMGERAVELLMLQIKRDTDTVARTKAEIRFASTSHDSQAPLPAAEPDQTPHVELFDTELVVRQSAGPPPRSAKGGQAAEASE